ncbi:MAG: TRADD-N-associated membrane domain-containing protein [Bryobacteraceae bacterium]
MVPNIRLDGERAQSLAGLDEITRPIHDQRMVEARVTFWSSMTLLAIGTAILVIGAFSSGPQMQAAELVSGALLNLIGSAILKLHKDAHARLDRFHRDRDRIHMIRVLNPFRTRSCPS